MENDPMEEEPPLSQEEMDADNMQEGEGEEEELDEDEAAEFSLLNRQLDQLDQALDVIEQKNDDIHSKLRELLEESRQARREIEAENNENNTNPHSSAFWNYDTPLHEAAKRGYLDIGPENFHIFSAYILL